MGADLDASSICTIVPADIRTFSQSSRETTPLFLRSFAGARLMMVAARPALPCASSSLAAANQMVGSAGISSRAFPQPLQGQYQTRYGAIVRHCAGGCTKGVEGAGAGRRAAVTMEVWVGLHSSSSAESGARHSNGV